MDVMARDSENDKQLKVMAALHASRPGVVEHVRRTGRLPGPLHGSVHIGIRLLRERRGSDFELNDDEKLVYDAVVLDQMERSAKRRKEEEAEPAPRDLVYGETPWGALVFIERKKALEHRAVQTATTWGDIRVGAPGLYYNLVFDKGCEEDPADDEEFEWGSYDAGGEPPYFYAQLMLDFIPASVQEKYGAVTETALDGEMLELNAKFESEIVEALRNLGFSIEKNSKLVESLYA